MNKTVIEETIRIFPGTVGELDRLIQDYIRDYKPILQISHAMDERGVLFVERQTFKNVPAEDGGTLMQSDQITTEGVIRITTRTENPPLAKFVCRSYTEDCKQLAAELVKEIEITNGSPKLANVEAEQANLQVKAPRCPQKGSKKYIRWQIIWRKIRGWIEQGYGYSEIEEKLEGTKLSSSADLIADIAKAGNAGKLD